MQLKRNTADKLFCGVLSGVALYLGVSPLFMRIAFIILSFIHPVFIFAYVFLALLLPAQTEEEQLASRTQVYNEARPSGDYAQGSTQTSWKGSFAGSKVFFASLCITVGVFTLLFRGTPLFSLSSIGALIVLVGGFYLFAKNIILLSSSQNEYELRYTKHRMYVGIMLLILGIFWMMGLAGIEIVTFASLFVAAERLWPVGLIAAGLLLLVRKPFVRRMICLGALLLLFFYALFTRWAFCPASSRQKAFIKLTGCFSSLGSTFFAFVLSLAPKVWYNTLKAKVKEYTPMKKDTLILSLKEKEKEQSLRKAARIIQSGGTVCFPTETVYGLGANALDQNAVEGIYVAKGRPSDNPLICHVCDEAMLFSLCASVGETAKKLIRAFMPGPITLVLKKNALPAPGVSKNIDTVGIRMPMDENARELIRLSGVPIAAPSANLSGKPSCTDFSHVLQDMDGRVDAILDGGECSIGLESTVVDVSSDIVKILRYGKITPEEIELVTGQKVLGAQKQDFETVRSPGMKYTHYKPSGDVVLLGGSDENVLGYLEGLIAQKSDKNTIAVLAFDDIIEKIDIPVKYAVPRDLSGASHALFAILRDFDRLGLKTLYAQEAPYEGIGLAYMDRLNHSAGYVRINTDEEPK